MNFPRITKFATVTAAAAACAALSTSALAVQVFTGSSGSLAASATFTASLGFFDVALTNLQTDPVQGAGNELTGISFNTTANLADAAQSSYRSGDLVEITDAGAKISRTDPAQGAAGFGWAWSSLNYLSALPGSVGENGPDLGIIASAATSFGSSLKGDSHNPLFQGTVVFRVLDSDVTANTTFSSVVFRFNTDGQTLLNCTGNNCAPTPAIPEPETYALMLAGLGAVGFMARRRRQA